MNLRRITWTLSLSVLLVALNACDSSTTNDPQVAEGGVTGTGIGQDTTVASGIGGTGITQGSITGFGSIWVNGVEFETTTANIDREGMNAAQGDLDIGMVVTIEGTVNADGVSGTATKVSYGKTLEGPITAMPNSSTLTVLGQTIIIDNLTKFKISGITAPSASDLAVNDVVEASGLRDASGALRATFIEVKQPGGEFELNGAIDAVNGTDITIGSQTIDIAAATLNNFGSQSPAVGDYVEVKGSTFSGATLVANQVELKTEGLGVSDADHVQVQGFVISFSSATEFSVGSQAVTTNSLTEFEGGIATDIQAGIKVEIEGALVNGVIVATKVKFEDSIELEADVASIDSVNNTLTLTGINGVTITTNDVLTEYGGVADFSGISVGKHIAVRGRQYDSSGCAAPCILATQLEMEDSKPDLVLRGEIDATPNDPYLSIMGMTIDTTAIPDSGFEGDTITDRATFFSTATQGDMVEISGTLSGANPLWEAIELDK